MMTWTYPQLAAAAALLPAGLSDADAATALGAQVLTILNQSFPVHSAKLVAMQSVNASWARITQRARQTAALPPTTELDAAILAAITVTEMCTSDTQLVDPNVPDAWAAWQSGIAALFNIGDLSATDTAKLAALPTIVSPAWTPPPTADDVAAARGLV